jgi:hypothetical protein
MWVVIKNKKDKLSNLATRRKHNRDSLSSCQVARKELGGAEKKSFFFKFK